jgi:hypothetical protein
VSRVLITQILTYCDVCRYDGREEVPAEPGDAIMFEIQGKPKRVDVCTSDKNPKWDTITACMVDDIDPDRKAPVKVQADRPHACPVCDLRVKSPQGLATHMSKAHDDIPADERQRIYIEAVGGIGNVSKSTASKLRNPPNDPCPISGCDKLVAGHQGLRMHILSGHPKVSAAQREKYARSLHALHKSERQLALEAP